MAVFFFFYVTKLNDIARLWGVFLLMNAECGIIGGNALHFKK